MIVLGLLCTIIGICRTVNAVMSDNEKLEKVTKIVDSPIEINPDVIRGGLIIIGIIELFCGLYVWFNA